MNKAVKIILEIVLAAGAVALVYFLVASIQKPVKFDKELAARSQVGIQRLKDIRTLQVAFKSATGHFTADIDSLINYYNEGQMEIVMQIGSNDDSLAVANTAAVKKKNRKITPEQLMELYRQGQSLVFSVTTKIPVRDTLFHGRTDFCADSLAFIPFSGGQKVEMEAIVKTVSGVQVPLFEARMPYRALCVGMDNQLRINKDEEMRNMNRYEGLQVGSITAPNNNAGNWE